MEQFWFDKPDSQDKPLDAYIVNLQRFGRPFSKDKPLDDYIIIVVRNPHLEVVQCLGWKPLRVTFLRPDQCSVSQRIVRSSSLVALCG